MDNIINYFNLYYYDREYIKNILSKKYHCEVEFGNYAYNEKTGYKYHTQSYNFILKKKNIFKDLFNKCSSYQYYTMTDLVNNGVFDEEYLKGFCRRQRHILKNYKEDMIQYFKDNFMFYVLAYNAEYSFEESIFDEEMRISIEINSNHGHVGLFPLDIIGFKQMRHFYKNLEFLRKNEEL